MRLDCIMWMGSCHLNDRHPLLNDPNVHCCYRDWVVVQAIAIIDRNVHLCVCFNNNSPEDDLLYCGMLMFWRPDVTHERALEFTFGSLNVTSMLLNTTYAPLKSNLEWNEGKILANFALFPSQLCLPVNKRKLSFEKKFLLVLCKI